MKNWARTLIVAVALVLPAISSPIAWSQPEAQRIEISARRFSFTPGEITVKKGQPVVLVLKSLDVTHGLRIRELGVDVKIKAGQTVEVKFTPDAVGDFVGHCAVFCGPGHGSMAITVHVVA
jgi:cytochrome c oxidase subunit 2